MAQKHNEQYVNAPMTRLGTIGWPDQDRRVLRSSAFVASKWTAENPILQLGEVGYETDTNKLKVGDGVTKWNSLPYAGDGTGSSLPDQTGHSGEFLTTDGTDASWGAVSEVPSTTGATEGDVLTVDSNGDPAWTTPSGGGLPDQTGQSGKFLTTDGTDASWSDKPLVNKATGTNGLAIGNSLASGIGSIAIGSSTYNKMFCVCIGDTAAAEWDDFAVGIGKGSRVAGTYAVGIGAYAGTGGTHSIQIGSTGTNTFNNDANTMKVANANGNFEMMNANGNLPADRLASTTGLADGNYRLRLTMSNGTPTLSWVAE